MTSSSLALFHHARGPVVIFMYSPRLSRRSLPSAVRRVSCLPLRTMVVQLFQPPTRGALKNILVLRIGILPGIFLIAGKTMWSLLCCSAQGSAISPMAIGSCALDSPPVNISSPTTKNSFLAIMFMFSPCLHKCLPPMKGLLQNCSQDLWPCMKIRFFRLSGAHFRLIVTCQLNVQ